MKAYPRLKFCGLTREIDIQSAMDAGAAAVGFNFVPTSKRVIDTPLASTLSRYAAQRIQRIGIFANASPEEVLSVLKVCALDAIQLHGDEGLDWLQQSQRMEVLKGLPLIRALPYRGPQDDERIALWSGEANDPNSPVVAILVDAFDPVQLGGTGKTARWDLLFPRPPCFFACKTRSGYVVGATAAPLILAGGIHRHNVVEAMRVARPEGIDLASGIEISPGIKDPDAMFAMAELVRSGLEHRNSGKD